MRNENDQPRVIVQLAASPFLGGPEQQMLGLAGALPAGYRSVFVAFPDKGSSATLIQEARQRGFEGHILTHDAPHYRKTIRELADMLQHLKADVVCCHGYKPDILGWRAARKAGCPVVAVAHGWTGATWKVRLNEMVDKFAMRRMDRVVAVSEGMAVKLRKAGVAAEKIAVIRNAIRADLYATPDAEATTLLRGLFAKPRRWLIGAAGRLSPEKGFGQLIEAASLVKQTHPEAGFVLFGRGPLLNELAKLIAERGLEETVILGGFRTDLERFWASFDLAVLPSFTEGLPIMVLEALAAGVPVVATAVGGTPEVVREGDNGWLVPAGQPAALAERIRLALDNDDRRRAMGQHGKAWVAERFTFETQSQAYQQMFEELLTGRVRAGA